MRSRFVSGVTGIFVFVVVFCATISADWAVTSLHDFQSGPNDGAVPYGSLTLGGSKLYGMTSAGGDSNNGVVFSIGVDGSAVTILHEFAGGVDDGRYPCGGLALNGSTLYGMTLAGGDDDKGVAFRMAADGSGYTIIHEFTGFPADGEWPYGTMTVVGSSLYGITSLGGYANAGVVFRMDQDGSNFTVLHEFSGSAGRATRGSLTIEGSMIYGMTTYGGIYNHGVIFSMDISGSDFTLLHEFAGGVDDGRDSHGSLVISGSKLCGMTTFGGDYDAGVVFSIGKDGSGFKLLHEFRNNANDGGHPWGSLTADGPILYGATDRGGDIGAGVIFSLNADGSNYQVQHEFAGPPTEGACVYFGELTQGGSLPLYGMTYAGGAYNFGTVFVVTPEPGAIVLLALGVAGLAAYRRKQK